MDNLQVDLKEKTVAYQGLEGSYTYECLIQNVEGCVPQSYLAHASIIRAVQDGRAEYALLPIENSTMGRISDVHQMLVHSGLEVIAEFYHEINHCLLAVNDLYISDIKNVHSMAPALSQCRDFLQENNLNAVPHADTTAAAKMLGDEGMYQDAAIASKEAAEIYNLKIIKEDIQDTSDNTTRFFLLGKKSASNKIPLVDGVTGGNLGLITALFFTVKNIPAALFKCLSGFATNGVDITKLESFVPMHGDRGAQFYIEVAGGKKDLSVQQALEELAYYASDIEHLGTFEKKSTK